MTFCENPSTMMWWAVRISTCSSGASRNKWARSIGPSARSNGALASARIDSHNFCSRSGAATSSSEDTGRSINWEKGWEGWMIWINSSPSFWKVVRRDSCRSTSNRRLSSRWARETSPVSRTQARMWSAGFPGTISSSAKNRRCATLAGLRVSTGWMAGIRGKAAALIEGSGFMERVRELLKSAPAVHADETPARAAGGMRYVHLACTAYLSMMHTGDRSAPAIDAGGVLPGYAGIIVRDGYHAGYGHLTDALHAWCGAHYADMRIMPTLVKESLAWTRKVTLRSA